MNLILLSGTYFLILVTMFFVYKSFLDKEICLNKKVIILSLIFGSIIDAAIHKYALPVYGAIYNCVFFLIIVKVAFKINIQDTIFYGVIVWLPLLLTDISLMYLFKYINSNLDLFNDDVLKTLATVLIVIILYTLGKNNYVKKSVNNLHKFLIKDNLVIIKFICLIVLYICFDGICLYYNAFGNLGTLILFLAISIMFIIIAYWTYSYNLKVLKETNELLIKNNVQLEISLTDYRVIKHNIRNKLLGIKAVANEKTKALIDDMLKEYSDNNDDYDITNVPSGLNGIVYEKIAMYKEENLNITTINHIDEHILEKITPKSYNLLCEALGVVLDNAMEAAKESEDKIVYLHFKEVEDQIKIKVMNTYTGIIDIEKLGTINYTSKKKGHGIGLFSLIEKKKLDIRNSLKNNFFITNIVINKLEQ